MRTPTESRRQRRRNVLAWRYDPGPSDIERCARCGECCMAFPTQDSRLCAVCAHDVLRAWPDRRVRRVLQPLLDASTDEVPLRAQAEALVAALRVTRCEVLLRSGRQLTVPADDAALPTPEDVLASLSGLAGPRRAGDLPPGPAAETFRARAWEAAAPLGRGEELAGILAVGAKRDARIFTDGELFLLGVVASGLGAALENARLEDALAHAARLRSVGMMAAGVAHDVRNLLVPVKTLIDLLPSGLGGDDLDRQRELAASELDRALALIAELLAVGRPQRARPGTLAPAAVVEHVVDLLGPTARERGVSVSSSTEPGLPRVRIDAEDLKQIVLNLMLNAVQASPAGRAVQVDLRSERAGTSRAVVLDVRDEGPGVEPNDVPHLFEPFFSRKEGGTGLGLALVQQLVASSGGEVTVESTPRGTAFHVMLPPAAPRVARASDRRPASRRRGRHQRPSGTPRRGNGTRT